MRNPYRLLLIVAAVLPLMGCAGEVDRRTLTAGRWKVERMEQDGRALPLPQPFEFAFAAQGSGVTITSGDKVHKGVYELVTLGKDPREIDISPDASNEEDRPLQGIYALDADGSGLVLCLSTTKRPTSFKARSGTDGVLLRLRRLPN